MFVLVSYDRQVKNSKRRRKVYQIHKIYVRARAHLLVQISSRFRVQTGSVHVLYLVKKEHFTCIIPLLQLIWTTLYMHKPILEPTRKSAGEEGRP
jgi:hypothetical protein